jgi:hypothetical protein
MVTYARPLADTQWLRRNRRGFRLLVEGEGPKRPYAPANPSFKTARAKRRPAELPARRNVLVFRPNASAVGDISESIASSGPLAKVKRGTSCVSPIKQLLQRQKNQENKEKARYAWG